jgi:hypothetical protein
MSVAHIICILPDVFDPLEPLPTNQLWASLPNDRVSALAARYRQLLAREDWPPGTRRQLVRVHAELVAELCRRIRVSLVGGAK